MLKTVVAFVIVTSLAALSSFYMQTQLASSAPGDENRIGGGRPVLVPGTGKERPVLPAPKADIAAPPRTAPVTAKPVAYVKVLYDSAGKVVWEAPVGMVMKADGSIVPEASVR